ncbi:sugar phosphotransferase [Enterococcus italicus]
MSDFPIDIVVTWVDSNDLNWTKKKETYCPSNIVDNDAFNNINRYRDIGLFKFWFRSIEKYAPWVNHIYLVTDQQVPDFLNVDHKKITVVDHRDIIDKKYLPTFNSSTIELNIHKIKRLSEHFLYFNDDMFINNYISPDDFFTDIGKVKDTISQSIIIPTENYDHVILNNNMVLNRFFSKKSILKKQWYKFFSPKQGLFLFVLNIMLIIYPKFTRLYDPHTAFSIIKTQMIESLSVINEELKISFLNKGRGLNDISMQWVRYYQIAKGKASVRNPKFSKADNQMKLLK